MKSQFLPVLTCTVSALAISAMLGGVSFAQAPAAPAAPGAPGAPATAAAPAEKPKPLAAADDTYVKNAVHGLSYLIAMAKTLPEATDKTKPEARLRDTTVKDLTAAQKALDKVIEAHGIKVSTELVGNDKMDVDRVTKGFAKTNLPEALKNKPLLDWTAEMLKESKRLDRETETIGKQGQDADLKSFATNYGPSVRNVFTTAESLDKSLKTKKK